MRKESHKVKGRLRNFSRRDDVVGVLLAFKGTGRLVNQTRSVCSVALHTR